MQFFFGCGAQGLGLGFADGSGSESLRFSGLKLHDYSVDPSPQTVGSQPDPN